MAAELAMFAISGLVAGTAFVHVAQAARRRFPEFERNTRIGAGLVIAALLVLADLTYGHALTAAAALGGLLSALWFERARTETRKRLDRVMDILHIPHHAHPRRSRASSGHRR